MTTDDEYLNEAIKIYNLALVRKIEIDLAIYMAIRLEERSIFGAEFLKYLLKTKPQFIR